MTEYDELKHKFGLTDNSIKVYQSGIMPAAVWEKSWWVNDGHPNKHLYTTMLEAASLNILNYMEHRFVPHGYTGLWLLSESHFAVHSWPEHNKHHASIASCNEEKFYKFDKLMKDMQEMLR